MKQTQVLKTFLKGWSARLEAAQTEASSTGSIESRARVEVLQEVVNSLNSFFSDFQVVKRPPKKGRTASKVVVSEDDTTVTSTSRSATTAR